MPTLNLILANGLTRTFALRRSAVIGRDPGCDIRIQDPLASRQHALFYLDSERQCFCCDLHSLNGIFVGNARMPRALVPEGGEVRIGNTRIRYSQRDPAGDTISPDDSSELNPEQTDPLIGGSLSETGPVSEEPVQAPELRILHRLSQIMRGTPTQERLFDQVVELARESVQPLQVLLLVLGDNASTPVLSRQWPEKGPMQIRDAGVQLFLQRVLREGRAFQVPNAITPGSAPGLLPGPRALLCAPMESPNRILGVLFLLHAQPNRIFSQPEMRLVSGIGLVTGMIMENLRLYGDMEAEFFGALEALASSLDAKDPYTAGHSRRVASISLAIARHMTGQEIDVIALRLGALLHDIGKIGVDDTSLRGKGKLSDEEYAQIKQHPVIGDRILCSIGSLARARAIARHHHERWDGRGYPDRLVGEKIPPLARIVCVADAIDAMTSNRSYRDASPMEHAVQEVHRCSGTQFDPEVAAATLLAFEAGQLQTERLGLLRLQPGERNASSTLLGE